MTSLAWDKETIKAAPNVDVASSHRDEAEEAEPYRSYGMGDAVQQLAKGHRTVAGSDRPRRRGGIRHIRG